MTGIENNVPISSSYAQSFKKILTTAQLREADNHTIQSCNIHSLELMEKAAHAFIHAIEIEHLSSKKCMIVCGTGNNGGDGLAIGRLLREQGMNVEIVLVKYTETLSHDCKANLAKLDDVIVLDTTSDLPDFSTVDLIIDGIFGSGLTRPVVGLAAKVIEAINKTGKTVYSIDVPSGLNCDGISNSDFIIEADLVISFQRPKLAFFLPENGAFVKNWKVVDIGLDEQHIQAQNSTHFVLDETVRDFVKVRQRQSHKGTYGHALLMAGSYGKMGAAVLSAKGCLRSGVGLLTTYVPNCGYEIMQISVPEAMCSTDESLKTLKNAPEIEHYDAIGIGPGIGRDISTANMLEKLLINSKVPLVLDADALNSVSENPELLQLLPENTILTPHIKEFDRLAGASENSAERLTKQRAFSIKYKSILVLKDANTCISSSNGDQFFNTSGNPGMATGGSGDVLTGIITGLLAQHYEPLSAALIAVYFHGLAGNKAAALKGQNALLASDICENLQIEREENETMHR